MPEIALTAQFLDRFAERFGVRPAEWHSQLAPRKRARTWRAVADNEVQVIVGARSALFLPYADLGLIVVDEEHDQAYKQEDGVHYHARDMAVVRASIEKIPVDPVVGDAVGRNRGECAARALSPSAVAGALRRPASAAYRSDRPEDRRPAARPLHRAAPGGSRADRARTRRAGACCSSTGAAMRRSPCAAPAGIASPARIAMPGWSITASSGGWSAIIAASACRCRKPVRNAQTTDTLAAVGPGVERLAEEVADAVSRQAQHRAVERSCGIGRAAARRTRRGRGGTIRHRHRHAARRQGPSFPEAQSGRHRRRRSRSRQRRSARGRAHLPAAASGRRPRRPRGGAGPRLPANASAGASGDARADLAATAKRSTRRRSKSASAAAIRRSAGSRRSSSPAATSTKPKAMRARSRPRRRSTTTCACSDPPKRRSRSCAGAIASGCW